MENGIIKNLKILYESVKETLYPSRGICFKCSEESDNNISLCSNCILNLNYSNTVNKYILENQDILKCYSVSFYSGVIKDMILKLKYKSNYEAGEALAYLMYNKLQKINSKIDYITYVPMFKKDEKKRGFNQSKYLAKELSKLANIKVKDFLIKIKVTKDQIGLSKEERNNNIKDCFQSINKNIIKDKRILLIDDVITTGSTVVECVNILNQDKFKEIIVLTVAKSTV